MPRGRGRYHWGWNLRRLTCLTDPAPGGMGVSAGRGWADGRAGLRISGLEFRAGSIFSRKATAGTAGTAAGRQDTAGLNQGPSDPEWGGRGQAGATAIDKSAGRI